ncbi:MAG: nucleotidyltransferase family protein [Nibricoccus sp.]
MNNGPSQTPAPASLKFGAIILAAGSSSRLGQPKQLLHYEGLPLVTRAAEAALGSGASPVVVVLGAHAEKIRPVLPAPPLLIFENSSWAEGMAFSIRAGLTALESAIPTLDAVLIALCDQPHFSAASVTKLTAVLTSTQGATIAATRHSGGAGVPAIFSRAHFPALHALRGAEGARRIIAAHTATTALVDLPDLALDIDTAADWERLNSP